MSQSNNTPIVRKRGTDVVFPYSEELAANPKFVVLTVAEAKEQGLLDKRRHNKPADPQVAEMAALLKDMKVRNAALEAQINALQEAAVRNDKATPAETSEVVGASDLDNELAEHLAKADAPQEPDETPDLAKEASELSELLAEIESPAAAAG